MSAEFRGHPKYSTVFMCNCGDMSAHVPEEVLYCIEEITSKTIIISIDNLAIFLYILQTK